MALFKNYSESIDEFIRDFALTAKFSGSDIDEETEIPVYDDLTVLSSKDLGAYASFLRAYSIYFRNISFDAYVHKEFMVQEEERALAEASVEASRANPKATAGSIKNEAMLSSHYKSAQNQLLGAKLRLEAVNQAQENIKDLITTVSREISRRIGANDKDDY